MQELIARIKKESKEITYEELIDFINTLDLEHLEFETGVPEPAVAGDYGRNILCLDPFECVLINWPPTVESAIHHHAGLFGYVYVLEGEADNILYKEEDGKLIEYRRDKYFAGGIMPEPDGVIHKIKNPNKTHRAVTLHFYSPALVTLEDLRLFNIEERKTGTLSAEALTASWSEEQGHFKQLIENAFDFVPFAEYHAAKTHCITQVFPKPPAKKIKKMIGDYFDEQAHKYDWADFTNPNRRAYTETIDKIISEDLKDNHSGTDKYLDVATGTGRRAVKIRKESGMDYEIVGVDISKKMIKLAEERGIRTFHQDWANNDVHTGEMFDAASYLYAFGHIPTEQERIKSLRKINSYLNPGAPFYFDLFNRDNENEWGPNTVKSFHDNDLGSWGYLEGDVFYKRSDGDALAFLHYFTIDEIENLLSETGFAVERVWNIGYAKRAGEIVDDPKQGFYLVKAVKV